MDMQHDHAADAIDSFARTGIAEGVRHAIADTHDMTYDMLMQHVIAARGAAAGQGTKNHCSHLRRWVDERGLAMTHPIGAEFDDAAAYRAALEKHLKRAKLKNDKDRRSSLSLWRNTYLELRRTTLVPETLGLAACLQAARAALGYGRLAKASGVPARTLRSWEAGCRPGPRSRKALERLERVLNLPAGRLTSSLSETVRVAPFSQRECTPFGIRQRACRRLYGLRYRRWPESTRREWQELLRFKTCTFLPAGMSRSGTWRTRSPDDYRGTSDESDRIAGLACPAARKNTGLMALYYGWLVDVAMYPGALSLVAVCDVAWLERYLQWQFERQNAYTASQLMILNFATALLRRKTGFVRQHPEFAGQLADPVLPEAWDDWCDRAKARLDAIKTALKNTGVGSKQKSRDPKQPIARILMLANPLDAIAELLDGMEALLSTYRPDSTRYALLCRDRCLIALLSAIPLRANQFASMRWRADNTGNLYKYNGVWSIRFGAEQFKNTKSDACRDLDQPLPQRVYRDLERYLAVGRPKLCNGKETDDLFIARRGNSIKVNTLYFIIQRHSARHIAHHTPSGFGPQAMRHIGATAFLKQNPGAFPLVAQLLNDKLETVMREYGHLGHQDGFRRYEDLWQRKAT